MRSCCIHDPDLGFTGQICQVLFDNSTHRATSFNFVATLNSTVQMCYSSTCFFCFPNYFWHYNNHNMAVNVSLLSARIDSDMLWGIRFYCGNKLPQVQRHKQHKFIISQFLWVGILGMGLSGPVFRLTNLKIKIPAGTVISSEA